MKYADMLYVGRCIVNKKMAYMLSILRKGQLDGYGGKGERMGKPREAVPQG